MPKVEEKVSYCLTVADPGVEAPADMTLDMSREQAFAMAVRIHRFLADFPSDRMHLPVGGVLRWED
jgi:hypothetical protein